VLTVVTGPPCSGKSTYAWSRAQPGDIVVDFDRIAQALGSGSPHDHPDAVRWVAIAARRAAVNSAIIQHEKGATVWLVHSRIPAKDMERYLRAGAEVVTLDVDPAELHARAARERPERWHTLIDEWKAAADPRPKRPPNPLESDPLYRRGRRGRPYRRWRQAILDRSTICWVCGHPGADSADHIEPLADIVARGGDPLDPGNGAPAHHSPCATCGRRCNPARGRASGRGVTDGDGMPGAGTQGGRSRMVTAETLTPVSTDTW
jgi:hypothetical protein